MPIVFHRDLAPIRLHSRKDPAEITEPAEGMKGWRRLALEIEKAAEASQTKNLDATRQ